MKSIFVTLSIILGISTVAFGQAAKHTENSADQALRGSGRVNASTLGMEINIPLGNYPGRGINVPISLSYSSKIWRMNYVGDTPGSIVTDKCRTLNEPTYAENTASGWTTSLTVPYIEYVGKDNFFTETGFPWTGSDQSLCTGQAPPQTDYAFVRRLVIHLPGGETHEMRADDTPVSFEGTQDAHLQQSNWNRTFYAVDGSNLRYVEDSTTGTYKLLMPDGSFYEFATTTGDVRKRYAIKFTDRNGNYTTYNTNGTLTDTLGRTLSPPIPAAAPTPTTAGNPQTYTMPGMSGNYKFHWKRLNGVTQAESALTDISHPAYQLKYRGDKIAMIGNGNWSERPAGTFLFGSLQFAFAFAGGESLFNPVVLTEIELPTGQKFKFSYDIYGRIEKITYPTGGEEVFTYSYVAPLTAWVPDSISDAGNFGVATRKVYETPGGSFYQWTYSVSSPGYRITTTNPDDTQTERVLHQGNAHCQYCDIGTFGYDNVLAGMAYEESAFDASNPRKLVSKKLTTWTKKAFVTSGVASADWHPRVTQEEARVYDSTGNGVSATTKYEYEGDLNLRETPVLTKKSSQYAFVPVGGALPSSPLRSSENTFLINDPNYVAVKPTYTGQNMMGLVTASVVKNGAGTIVSKSEMVYDESGRSPGQRGFVTTARAWDSTKGASTSPSAYIFTRAKFDYYGNQYESTDAKGNTTTTTFDGTYQAFPLQVTSPIPDQTGGTYGSTTAFVTTTEFNTTTGLPLSTTDANGLKTAIEYDANTLRPRYTRTYVYISGFWTQVGSTSETIYNDTAGNIFVRNRSQIDTNNWAETKTYFDGLGRAWKTEEVNSNGNIFVEKQFDGDGRVLRVSNPYRNGETVKWTTNVYDNASRVVSVTLPDNATVGTEYGVSTTSPVGVTKQITDQAQKKRKGFTDALGNMVRVVEDPTGQNLSTDYIFDTLGNLRKTTQGTQMRFFMHDSLGRLLFAKQPEQDVNGSLVGTDSVTGWSQWSAKYAYDDGGNITSTTDARNQTISAQYDRLNRLQIRDYVTDTLTPDVKFYYDGKGLPSIPAYSKGKTTKVYTNVSATEYNSFDEFGRVKRSKQITDGVTYGDDTNPMTYTYNLSGALVEQKYPSGRVVKNTIDANGDLAQIQSKKNASSGFFTYADAFAYNSAGAIKKMQLGNGKWETFKYNDRQQIAQIGLGTTDTDVNPNLLKLEFSYGNASQNNGSMLEQKITVPTVGGNPGFTAIQTYTYDSLNRIQSARETVGGAQTWKQTFIIDRYGNREYDPNATNTTTIGSCLSQVCNPDINAQGNNRFSNGQGYSYDANGNVTQDATSQRFHYDAENHQKSFFSSSNPGGTPDWTYTYDGDGRRVKKASATEQTVFVYDASGKLVAEYSSALAPVQQVSYLTTDHLGSPRITTNQLGAVTNRKDFTAYGDEAISAQRVAGQNGNKYEASSPTRKDYTGYEKDMESGLEFAQARYFSPTHGRFTSVDPLTASANVKDPQTLNRYSYVLNSPYKFTDPLGLLSVNSIACGACGNESLYVDGSAFRGTDETLKTQNEIWRDMVAQVRAALGIAEGRSALARPVQDRQNPTYPGAPSPGSADFTTPDFAGLNGSGSTPGAQASRQLLIVSNGGDTSAAEAQYNAFTDYERAVLINTVAALQERNSALLDSARFVGFYNGQSSYSSTSGRLAFGVVLSGVTTAGLDKALLGKSGFLGLGGRRSPRKDEIASLEATSVGSNTFAFDIDLYNSKSNFRKHLGEVRYNRRTTATTHPADVSRALFMRGISSGVTTK